MEAKDLYGKRVAGLFSGGLDSTTIVSWLSLQGVEVVSLTVDLGQPDEKNLDDIIHRMEAAGAVEAYLIDGKSLLADYMMQVIQGLGHHEGSYMNTTAIARMVTIKLALEKMKELELDILVHGATGRGNDQVRFELGSAHLEGWGIKVYAPWRDPAFKTAFGGRREMIEYCQRMKLKISATLDKPYSTDANFCGLTHEAGRLESIDEAPDYVDFLMGVRPKDAPNREEIIKVEFLQGLPIEVNGSPMNLVEVFYALNKIAGRNAIGIGIDVVENRFVGIKSRGVYESPAATLLEIMYGRLLQLTMDRERRKFFEGVSRQWADIVYEGKFYSPLAGDLWAVIANVARQVTGKLAYRLYKGNAEPVGAKRVYQSLYDSAQSSMENVGDFNHLDAQGFLNVLTVTARAMRKAGQTRQG